MKKTITAIALFGVAFASSLKAADVSVRLDIIGDVNQSGGSAFTGTAWFGNLLGANPAAGVGAPWTVGDIANSFRSAYSFSFDSTLINAGGSTFTVPVGSAPQPSNLEPENWPVINPTASGQFAGQSLMVLLSNRSSYTDLSAGTEWLVFEAAANFATANDITAMNSFVELSRAGGAILTLSSTPGFWIGGVNADSSVITAQAVTAGTTAVPEPSSASLMLLGAAGLMALRRLRKNI